MGQGVRLRIFATDPQRARAFYAQVFGWTLSGDEQRNGWVVTTADDSRLGIDGPQSASGRNDAAEVGIPTIHVADLDATTATALAAGGDVLVPRMPVPGVGWLVYLADTEGNLIGIMQDDPGATWPQAPRTRRRVRLRRGRPGTGVT